MSPSVATKPVSDYPAIPAQETLAVTAGQAKNASTPERTGSISAERSYYRPELDVLRFFAFLGVFLCHALPGVEFANHSGWERWAAWTFANFKASGSFGVCLFFVLSSFLITELLMRESHSSGKVDVKAFYIRRILRIWPLYFSFLLFGYILGQFAVEWRVGAPRFLAFMALAGNWYVASFGMTTNPIAPLWSISIEEQFYLTWPWMARWGGRRAILAMSVFLVPVSWSAVYFLGHLGNRASEACWYSSFVQFEFFALGALAALLLRGRIPSWSLPTRLGMMIVGASLWMMAEGWLHVRWTTAHSGPTARLIGYQAVGIGCVVLLTAFLGLPGRFIPRFLIYLGKISYGLYVFHFLWLELTTEVLTRLLSTPHGTIQVAIRALLSMPVELGLTIVTAILSYKFLEKPFLKLKERFTVIRSRAV